MFGYLYGCFVWSYNGAIELTAVSLFLDAKNSKIATWVQHKEYLQKLLAVCICAESKCPVYKMATKIELIYQQSAIASTVKVNFKVSLFYVLQPISKITTWLAIFPCSIKQIAKF